MTSIFPNGGDGGVTVRDSEGNPIPVTNVPNAYIPAAEFSISCSFNYLRNDCFSRVSPSQVNALVSELVCFTEFLDPEGTWNCTELCNIRTAFEAWVERFVSEGISTDLCAVPVGPGTENDASLIYCGNGSVLKLSIRGENGLFDMFQAALCTGTETANPPASARFIACTQDGGFITVNTNELRLYRGEWVQASAYRTVHMVQRDGKLWSPNNDIPGGTPFEIGTTGTTWREVSPSGFPPFNPDIGHPKDSVIFTNGGFYAANANIPAGTPFEIGTTGATWRPVDITKTHIPDYNNTAAYDKDSAVVVNGLIYRALGPVAPSAGFNPSQWQQIGGDPNRYHGAWVQDRAYKTDDLVAIGNKLWLANGNIPVDTPFAEGTTGATWREASPTNIIGMVYPTEMVLTLTGSWSAGETLMAYKAAKLTALPTSLLGTKTAALEQINPLDSSVTIYIDDIVVGSIAFLGEAATYDFPLSRTINIDSVLRIVADTPATFDFVTITLYAFQTL